MGEELQRSRKGSGRRHPELALMLVCCIRFGSGLQPCLPWTYVGRISFEFCHSLLFELSVRRSSRCSCRISTRISLSFIFRARAASDYHSCLCWLQTMQFVSSGLWNYSMSKVRLVGWSTDSFRTSLETSACCSSQILGRDVVESTRSSNSAESVACCWSRFATMLGNTPLGFRTTETSWDAHFASRLVLNPVSRAQCFNWS